MRVPTPVSFVASIALLAPSVLFAPAARAQNQLWITQFGTSSTDYANALTSDGAGGAGGAMGAGWTMGSLGGPTAGSQDVFLARYDRAGYQVWIRQFGTSEADEAYALARDGAGGVMVAGITVGTLGGSNAGGGDVFLARYDSAGNRQWIRQFGTSVGDIAYALAPDGAGGVMVAGQTSGSLGGPNAGRTDVFLARYDSAGNQLWIRQFGTGDSDNAKALAPDGEGGVMVGGSMGGSPFVSTDAFLARYDSSGNQFWLRRFGTTAGDGINALAPDGAGGVMVAGDTWASLGGPNAGQRDAFLARYDSNGDRLWITQFGTSALDGADALAPDGAGGVMVAGVTRGSLGGPHAGEIDAFLAHYDSAGNQTWIHQFSTSTDDYVTALAPSGAGSVMLAGHTEGDLGGPNAGKRDVIMARFTTGVCYADCDQSTGAGVLDIFDFLCFQNSFVNGEPYACDCDTTTGNGVCDIFDFLCFQDAFVAGCP